MRQFVIAVARKDISICISKSKKPTSKRINTIEQEGNEELKEYSLCLVDSFDKTQPLDIALKVDSQKLFMELDTGAAYSLVSDGTFKKLWPDGELSISIKLKYYSGDCIHIVGNKEFSVKY